MKAEEFNENLQMLARAVETEKADQLFMSSYESLLKEIKELPKSPERDAMLQRMQKLLFLQIAFEMNRWLREKKIWGMN
jgi:hypothetical protein